MSQIKIHHKIFGDGVIVSINQKYTLIKFHDDEFKRFLTRDFNKYFKCKDKNVKEKIAKVEKPKKQTPKLIKKDTEYHLTKKHFKDAKNYMDRNIGVTFIDALEKTSEIRDVMEKNPHISKTKATRKVEGHNSVMKEILTHCWNCQTDLTNLDERCSRCNYGIICPKCGNCICDAGMWIRNHK